MWMCHAGLTPGNEGYRCRCLVRLVLSNRLKILVAHFFNGPNSMRMAIHHGPFPKVLHVRQRLPKNVPFNRYSDVVTASFDAHFYSCPLN